jgi:hypothetical protein
MCIHTTYREDTTPGRFGMTLTSGNPEVLGSKDLNVLSFPCLVNGDSFPSD